MQIYEVIDEGLSSAFGPVMASAFLAEHEILGYILAGVLSFALGILVTVFCFRLRKHREEDDDRNH